MGNMGGGDRGAAVSYYEVPENSRNVVVVVGWGGGGATAASCRELSRSGRNRVRGGDGGS